jgi:hypothetical protein
VPGVHQPGWWTACPPAARDLRVDTSVPHPARVYGYWIGGKDNYEADRSAAEEGIGGKDNYEADRSAAEEVIRLRPQVVDSARANRAFLARAVRYLAAGCGIRQFLDIGTGLPAPDNTHQVAQRADPACRVVYVDNDPVVLSHARALLISTPQGSCDYVDADLRDPGAIIAQAGRTLDFTQPVAILLLAVLHFLSDADDPAATAAALADALAPGSCVAISHLTTDLAPAQVTAATDAYNATSPIPVTPRTHAQVTALFGGLPLLPPGVVPVSEWRPRPGEGLGPPVDLYAGVARVRRRGRA